jgi:hypothetical protein
MKDNAASFWRSPLAVGLLVVFVGLAGYGAWSFSRRGPVSDHRHDPGAHGGIIVAVGDEHHHVEALFAEGGAFKLFTLGKDQTQVVSVPEQKITAYVRAPESPEATAVVLQSKPQPGDPTGETSSFEGQLPLELVGSRLLVIVPSIAIGKGRYRFQFLTKDDHEAAMPQKVTDQAESDLYLKPGGKYTAADIKANGSTTASAKFRGFQSAHDRHPAKGDAICPITRSKANPKCTWIVGGKQYSFCCPPCVDEFVKLAKEHPGQIQDPATFVQQ